MKKNRLWILAVAILTVLLFVGCDDDMPHQLGPAPELAIQNLQTGSRMSEKNFLGKPLVIDFWASWCEPCREAMPDISNLAAKYEGKVNVIGVSAESPDQIKKFWSTSGNDYPAYADISRTTNQNFHVYFIPTVAIIDPKGNLVFEVTNPSISSVTKMLDTLLGKRTS